MRDRDLAGAGGTPVDAADHRGPTAAAGAVEDLDGVEGRAPERQFASAIGPVVLATFGGEPGCAVEGATAAASDQSGAPPIPNSFPSGSW